MTTDWIRGCVHGAMTLLRQIGEDIDAYDYQDIKAQLEAIYQRDVKGHDDRLAERIAGAWIRDRQAAELAP